MIINVVGPLTEDAQIGVTLYSDTGVFTSGLAENGTEANFVSDNSAYIVYLNADGEAELKAEAEFKKQNLILSGEIGVTFFMDLSALTEEELGTCSMSFSISGLGTVTEGNTVPDPTNMSGKENLYGFTCYVNSIQMADEITASFRYTKNGAEKTVTKTYSVEQYIQDYDAYFEEHPEEEDEGTTALVHALADYGCYVQHYLQAEHDWTFDPDDGYAEMTKCYVQEYNYADIQDDLTDHAVSADIDADGSVSGITFSLTLDSETAVNVFFRLKSGFDGDFTVSVKDQSGAALKSGEYTAERIGNRICVTIPGVKASELGNKFTVTVTAGGGTAEVTLSALSYAYAVLSNEAYAQNETAKNAAAAIQAYQKAAADWLAAHSGL